METSMKLLILMSLISLNTYSQDTSSSEKTIVTVQGSGEGLFSCSKAKKDAQDKAKEECVDLGYAKIKKLSLRRNDKYDSELDIDFFFLFPYPSLTKESCGYKGKFECKSPL